MEVCDWSIVIMEACDWSILYTPGRGAPQCVSVMTRGSLMFRRREGVRESVKHVRLGLSIPQILPQCCALELLSLRQEIVDILAGLCLHSLVIGRPVDDYQ